MKITTNTFITQFFILLSVQTNCHGGEYPLILNNNHVVVEGTNETGGPIVPAKSEMYILIKNKLVDFSEVDLNAELEAPYMAAAVDLAAPSYLEDNGTPRKFIIGDHDEANNRFTWKSHKLVSPTLEHSFRNYSNERNTNCISSVRDKPLMIEDNSVETKIEYDQCSSFHYRIDPPLNYEFINLPNDEINPVTNNEKFVRGIYELGGGLICGRKEGEKLVLYRLSCYQNTYPKVIDVFNQDERLAWDNELSDQMQLKALSHLKADLLEHNTGMTSNRLFIRMKPSSIKEDKPGETKAMRDWYLLAPFYDPATQTYRDTLTRQDFVADEGSGFDPNNADFDPNKFVRKLVPFTVPESFWNE